MRFALTAAVSVIALAACSPESEAPEAETTAAETAAPETMDAAQESGGTAMEEPAMDAEAGEPELTEIEANDFEDEASSWGYDGAVAPANWGSLNAEYAVCDTGTEQSPIDLVSTDMDAQNTPDINWTPASSAIVADTGYTVVVSVEDAGGLTLGGTEYALAQFHFHAGSEHTIDGAQYPLEVHFVHVSEDGQLAVVGMMFEDGAANDPLAGIWANLPEGEGETGFEATLDPNAFLPEAGAIWRYEGSLTTPPCSEGVAWTVFQTPLTASSEQLAAFTARYDNNFRPVQPLNARSLREGDAE
ncbi:MAG: carbonic anhydrase family protein [Oceanicaulis sp.]